VSSTAWWTFAKSPGDSGNQQLLPAAARVVGELRAMGVEPADVDEVIMSHAHADHVGGLVTAGEPTFARARHCLPRAERDFWLGLAPQDRLFPQLADALVATARSTIRVLVAAFRIGRTGRAARTGSGYCFEPGS
jgi:glyoxylase-like metal-dependent hydrolase (beta-lactamase superfamily II)